MGHAAFMDTRMERMSLDEWAALPEDEPGEIVDGYRVEDEVPENVHELVVAWLIRLFGAWASSRGGIVLGSGAKYVVAAGRGRMPDVSLFLPGTPRPPRRGLNRHPPTIAVEVVSETPRDARRDRVEKLQEYAAFGVRWYWIVDPGLRSVQIHELDAERRYVHVVDATDGIIEDVPGCEGLRVGVGELWSAVDALGAEETDER
ncbi:MAG TPA: Uma2 family endonuclease [Polyangiaceae bacterium]|nr:Uma2 family endonuclease [Polyangiaceae bacterium]